MRQPPPQTASSHTRAPGIVARHKARALLAAWLICGFAQGLVAAAVGDSLSDALHEIQRTGVRLIFSTQTVPPDLRVIAKPAGATAEERLHSLLDPHGLGLRQLPGGGWIIVEQRPGPAHSLVVDVVSSLDGRPVRGALVQAAQESRSAYTDRHGRAQLPNLHLSAYTVTIRADGYDPVSVRRNVSDVQEGKALVAELTPNVTPLAQIIVQTSRYGYGGPDLGVSTDRTREEVESTPGTNEDLARALQQLPGAAAGGISARTHIRGSRESELLFRFDGVNLINPYHLKDFQGLFSAIDPASSETTTFWTGAFPIEFGQRTGAVIDIEPRRAERRIAEIGLSVLNSSVLYGSPFAESRGSMLVSGRVSNLSRITQLLERDIGEPEFQDLLLRAEYRFTNRTRIAAGFIGLDDLIDVFTQSRSQTARAEYQDSYTWLRVEHEFNPDLKATTLLSRASLDESRDGTLARTGIVNGTLTEDLHSYFNTLRQEIDWSPAVDWHVRGGTEWVDSSATYEFSSDATFEAPFFPELVPTAVLSRQLQAQPHGWTRAGYAAVRWQPGPKVTAELGLRYDGQRLTDGRPGRAWSGRANLHYRLSEATTIRANWGQFAQLPWVTELPIADGGSQLPAAASILESNLSAEHLFDSGWTLRAEAYEKREHTPIAEFENAFSPLVLLPEIEVDRVAVNAAGGRMRGVEMTLQSDRARAWSGWLTYTWARAEDRIGVEYVPRSWDQRHTVQVGALWSRDPWRVSAIYNWHSGWPYTPLLASSDTWTDPAAVTLTLGPRNSARRPAFAALDLRGSREWPFARGTLELSLELRNAFSRNNVCCTAYSVVVLPTGESHLVADEQGWLGLTPLIGLRWRY
ncbi:MAG: TonB-dependent receptor [Steroidobacteraceae bacterium]